MSSDDGDYEQTNWQTVGYNFPTTNWHLNVQTQQCTDETSISGPRWLDHTMARFFEADHKSFPC